MKVKRLIFYLSLMIVFLLGFFISFTLSSNAYYQSSKGVSGQIILGKSNVLFMDELFSNQTAIFGETINCPVSVINANSRDSSDTRGLIDCYLRTKIDFVSNNTPVDIISAPIVNPNNWVQQSDGYYYYINIFRVGEELELFRDFIISNNVSEEIALAGVEVTIIVETIQADGSAYKTDWPTAPLLW